MMYHNDIRKLDRECVGLLFEAVIRGRQLDREEKWGVVIDQTEAHTHTHARNSFEKCGWSKTCTRVNVLFFKAHKTFV